MFNPVGLQMRPLAWLAFWTIVIAGIIGLLFAVTLGGALVFVLMAVVLVLSVYFAVRRIENRIVGY